MLVDEPSQDPQVRLKQLRVITKAYKALTTAEPVLPSPGSPLPALLALRSTLNLVDQTKTSIIETKGSISMARAQLLRGQADLKDGRSMTQALETRIEKLRVEYEDQSQKGPVEVAEAMAQEQQQQRTQYTKELRKLVRAFNRFTEEHLAAMIAAEDLGGPVVGATVEINEETLEVGFNQNDKAKKPSAGKNKSDAKRKGRNEERCGSEDGEDKGKVMRSEKEAAFASFRSLTEDLLNASAGDENSDTYVDLSRESAGARFLVRAKVAQFHPNDARKLRLIEFGGELGD